MQLRAVTLQIHVVTWLVLPVEALEILEAFALVEETVEVLVAVVFAVEEDVLLSIGRCVFHWSTQSCSIYTLLLQVVLNYLFQHVQ